MISKITGKVIEQGLGHLVIETAGIGYLVRTTPENASKILNHGQDISLWTYLAVREDALDLYGFSNKSELDFFKNLISVQGIGPKTALNILSRGNVERLKDAIASSDKDYLIKMAGLGKKMTEKIILELQNKLGVEGSENQSSKDGDILDALKALGYKDQESRLAIEKLPRNLKEEKDRLKTALQMLNSK